MRIIKEIEFANAAGSLTTVRAYSDGTFRKCTWGWGQPLGHKWTLVDGSSEGAVGRFCRENSTTTTKK